MSLFDDDEAMDEVEAKEAALAGPTAPEPRANPDLIAHDKIEKEILRWWETDTVPHTLILTGPQGIGKATFAFRLARFLLTHPDAPGDGLFGAEPAPSSMAVSATNPVSQRVASGGHADMMSLALTMNEKTGNMHTEILVDEVREVPLFLRKTAAEGGWRVVIIDQAEKLNRNAQNALLKILEEPPPRALLILVTQTAGALVPTIRSRSRVVQMDAPEMADFNTLMRKYRPDLSTGDIELLADVAGRAPGRALALLDQGGMAAIRGTLSMLDGLPTADDKTLWTMAEKLAVKATPDPLEGMLDVTVWSLQARARAAAAENANHAIKSALQTLDSLERHRTLCDKGNLDRRHMALGALRILQNGMKAA